VKRSISAFLALLVFIAPLQASAHWVGLYGSYYKERSTRIFSPMMKLQAELPWESEIQVGYLLDQITSASGAAGHPGEDAVFQEYRHEFEVAGAIQLLDLFKPALRFRYSNEPDYKSIGFDAAVSFDLFDDSTSLTGGFSFLSDVITENMPDGQVRDPSVPEFEEKLKTYLARVGLTQVLTPELIMGVDLETQIARGFQENQYRDAEQHPRDRNRYAGSIWFAYRIEPSRTTIRLDQRVYVDTWHLHAFTAELRVTQRIVPSLEIEPRIRFHIQDNVFFGEPVTRGNEVFRTRDPKLLAFNAQTFGLQLSWELTVLEGTFLEIFAPMLIQPYYAFLRQTSSYGNAHIAQLGALWPF
jgi:hypothetical protein